jgi:biopolymer transport protein ExbB
VTDFGQQTVTTPSETSAPNASNLADTSPRESAAEEELVPQPAETAEPSATAPYFAVLNGYIPEHLHDETAFVQSAADTTSRFLRDGGPSIWAIAALSVITVAIILWKIWRLALAGAWSKGRARKAVAAFEAGRPQDALRIVERRRGVRSKVVAAAISALQIRSDALAREDTTRVAKNELAKASDGLRALELIATIAPLLGLLGTVLGMIAAFQALQESGSRAAPALLAGGIWEALLTTAAGMAVAIPASAALSWFEAVIDRMRRDIEDAVTRIFVTDPVSDFQFEETGAYSQPQQPAFAASAAE